jgi:DNA-binding NarL/FixJ family response regulator
MEAVAAGAAGYILKGSRHEDVVEAVRAVLSGETPLDQNLAMRLLPPSRPGSWRSSSS